LWAEKGGRSVGKGHDLGSSWRLDIRSSSWDDWWKAILS
jgi:hypothetical protein